MKKHLELRNLHGPYTLLVSPAHNYKVLGHTKNTKLKSLAIVDKPVRAMVGRTIYK